ncbi:hypothetical protein G9A89_014760 [Geosiphon pyriformis]|nr:hypothetical protein G9A89_014760 [Geosiphon pyriformis]
MEKTGLVCDVGVVSGLPCGVSLVLSDGVVRLLGLADFFAVSFGRRKPYCFFSGLSEPTDSSAGSSDSVLTSLGTHSGVKSKRLASVHSCGTFYKKPKKPAAVSGVINTSVGLLSLEDLGEASTKYVVSWGSNVSSVVNNMSSLSDVENMMNLVAKETSYVESGEDDNIDKAMLRKTHTRTYTLSNLMKQPLFNNVSDDDSVLELLSCMLSGSNLLLPLMSHASEMRSFDSTKFFALDIELSVVSEKLVSNNLIKTREMAISKKILVNNDVKKANSCSDQEVIVKKIPVDLLRSAMESVFSKFGEIVFIKMQLIGFWQKTLVEFKSSEIASLVAFKWLVLMGKDSVHVALAIVGTTTHDLSNLLNSYGGKTCIVGCNLVTSVLIFKSVSLHWAGLFLACCAMCKHFGHVSDMCSVSGNSGRCGRHVVTPQNQACLADIYKKRQVPIAYPTQVTGGSLSRVVLLVVSGAKLFSNVKSLSMDSDSLVVASLNNCLMSLECSLEFLADQVSGILKRLSSAELVPLLFVLLASPSVISAPLDLSANLNIVLDAPQVSSFPPITVVDNTASDFGSSSSKILTTKVGGLKLKMMALDTTVETKLKGRVRLWIVNKFDGVRVFIFGLDSGYLGAGVVIVVNSSLAKHVCKVSEMPGWLLFIKLLFKNKLSVSILGLYTGASLVVQFFQAGEVNFFITKTVNESSFIVFGGDFNEDSLHKSASFRKCLDLGLINSLSGSPVAKSPT